MDPNHKHIKFSIKKVVLLQPGDEECERLVTDENDLFFLSLMTQFISLS